MGAVTRLHEPWHMVSELDLVPILAGHARLRHLCERLEGLADGLPDVPEGSQLKSCCDELEAIVPPPMAEEDRLLAQLMKQKGDLAPLVTRQIASQHLADRVHAQDLADALRRAACAGPASEPERLGYMLRCFFDGCRRAIAFEELAMLAVLGNRLERDAREALVVSLSSNRLAS